MARFEMYPLKSNDILQLFEWKEQINLDPPFQRLSVWDRPKRQSLIDSVINGFDIPKLYFHEVPSVPGQARQYRYAVVDGKQRLLALWEFMSDRLPLAKDFVFFDNENIKAGGATYSSLLEQSPRLRARFDSFNVPVTVVRTDDENFIEELFARLNIQVPLSAPERRNAMGGPLPYLIRKTGVCPFFTESVRIRNDRLQHFDLAAKFLYLTRVDAIESTKKLALNSFVREFRRLRDQGKPEASEQRVKALENSTQETLDAMHEFFRLGDPLLGSQGRVTLYFHVFRIWHRTGQIQLTREMLARFSDDVTAARKKSQRRALGSNDVLTDLEQSLVSFDREKQSANDAGAVKRQYKHMREYFGTVFNVEVPEPD